VAPDGQRVSPDGLQLVFPWRHLSNAKRLRWGNAFVLLVMCGLRGIG